MAVGNAAKAWWSYPLDAPGSSYGQGIDPLGNYLKPDVNVQTPDGTIITSLTGGTVTDVSDHGKCCGGLSVVIAMDTPLNRLATHVAYNFLGSALVRTGQRVTLGTPVGVAGSPYGILTAVGLTPDATWGNGNFFLNAQGNPLLDPHQLLNGKGPTGVGLAFNVGGSSISTGALGAVFGPAFMSVSNTTSEIINNVPGFQGLVEGLDNLESFQPFKIVSTGGQDIGILGKVPILGGIWSAEANLVTLPADAIQALLVFVTANILAFIVRAVIVYIGISIVITLIRNAILAGAEGVASSPSGRAAATIINVGAAASV